MISGKQSMSIFKDTRTLASKVVEMVDAVMKDASNYKELLIDSGYYTEADLQ